MTFQPVPRREPPEADNSLAVAATAEDRLEQFCQAALGLLRSSSGASVASFVAPVLARALADSSRELIDQLRSELQGWEAASAQLRQLANSRVLDVGEQTNLLLARLEQAGSEAERIVETLQALDDCTPPKSARADHVLTSHASDDPSAPELRPAPPPDRAWEHFEQAESFRRAGQQSQADNSYGDALRLDPTLVAAYLRRGRIRALQGRAVEAVDDFTAALHLKPDAAVAYWWRGDALALCQRLEAAVDDYSRALQIRPELFPVRYNRAALLRQLGDLPHALAEFDALIEVQPSFAPLYLNRGLIHLAYSRPARARVEFRTALRYKPDSLEARQRLREVNALLRARRQQPAASTPTQEFPLAAAPTVVESPSPSPKPKRISPPEPLPVRPPVPLAQPTVESAGKTSAPTPTSSAAAALANSLTINCPVCGQSSTVRWDKLQRGKVLGCPHCNARLTSGEKGTLIELVKDDQGRWVERSTREACQRRRRARRRWLGAGAAAAVLAAAALLLGPKVLLSTSRAEADDPRELEPRAKRFAEAWLSGDQACIRRLTDPTQDKLLFTWNRKHSPAAARVSADARVEVDMLPSRAPMAALRIRFVNPDAAKGKPALLYLNWQERGGVWVFQPAPGLEPKRVSGG